MKRIAQFYLLACLLLTPMIFVMAQPESNEPTVKSDTKNTTETNEPVQNNNAKAGLFINPALTPLVADGAYERITHLEREALPLPYIREADVAWSKRIWREINTKEKINGPFRAEYNSLIEVLLKIAQTNPDVQLFETDNFTVELSKADIANRLNSTDSVEVYDLEKEEYRWEQVDNSLDLTTFEKFRIKEDWIFDTKTSKMECRIIGIAPIRTVVDPNTGFVRGQEVLFWMHYPSIRKYLAKEESYNPFNDAITLSWQQMLDMHYFNSLIIKESNPRDRRISDYAMGIDALREADNIKEKLYNFEFDLWSH